MNRFIESLLVLIMGALTLVVLWQVIARYVMTNPSSWTEELARFMLVWVSILGAAYVSGKKEHIAIDIIQQRSSPSRRRRLQVLIDCIIIIFAFFVMVLGGINLVEITLHQISSALRIPVGYVYTVIPFSGILIIVYALLDIFYPHTRENYSPALTNSK
ncbi:MAG: TRAP transporter small permease [Bacteroidota bacterium]